jgi:microsomal epoxide hydrolase
MKFKSICLNILFLLAALSLANAAVRAKSETFRTSDGITLHYLDAGNGPTILFIPGWTMAADIFEPQINALSTQFRVISIDLRSQGDSEKASDGNYPARHAQDVKELMDHLKISSVVLVGWSNGVPDVLSFIDQFGSANLRGAVLVDGFVDASDAAIQKGMASFLEAFQTDRKKFTDQFVRGMYASKQSEDYIQHVEGQALKTPTNSAITELYNVLSKGDFTPALAKMDKPVLYICESRMEAQGKLLQAKVPKAQISVMKDAAHAMFVDDPAHFNQLVTDFVNAPPQK